LLLLKLAAGDDVEAEALLGDELEDGEAGVRLGGVGDHRVRITAGEGADEGTGLVAQVLFVEEVEGGAELAGEVDGVAAADREVSPLVDSGGAGQDSLEAQGRGELLGHADAPRWNAARSRTLRQRSVVSGEQGTV
jgi:hypothetical protein